MPEQAMNFLDLPAEWRDPGTARYAVLPVPYEQAGGAASSTAAGPLAVLDASMQVEWLDEEFRREFVQAGIATHPVVHPGPTVEEALRRTREAAEPILRDGKFLLSLGGEHSLTAALVAAAIEVHGPVSVLHVGASASLRDSWGGSRHGPGCVMRRLLELAESLCQVGIRSFSREELQACGDQLGAAISPNRIAADPNWLDLALSRLGEKVYVTINANGFDPSVAPGVARPVPGGLSWQQVTALLHRVCVDRTVVAADIMEVCPIPPNHVTEFTAARLGYKIIAYTQLGAGGADRARPVGNDRHLPSVRISDDG